MLGIGKPIVILFFLLSYYPAKQVPAPVKIVEPQSIGSPTLLHCNPLMYTVPDPDAKIPS
jgi:hypothetical protein